MRLKATYTNNNTSFNAKMESRDVLFLKKELRYAVKHARNNKDLEYYKKQASILEKFLQDIKQEKNSLNVSLRETMKSRYLFLKSKKSKNSYSMEFKKDKNYIDFWTHAISDIFTPETAKFIKTFENEQAELQGAKSNAFKFIKNLFSNKS